MCNIGKKTKQYASITNMRWMKYGINTTTETIVYGTSHRLFMGI